MLLGLLLTSTSNNREMRREMGGKVKTLGGSSLPQNQMELLSPQLWTPQGRPQLVIQPRLMSVSYPHTHTHTLPTNITSGYCNTSPKSKQ